MGSTEGFPGSAELPAQTDFELPDQLPTPPDALTRLLEMYADSPEGQAIFYEDLSRLSEDALAKYESFAPYFQRNLRKYSMIQPDVDYDDIKQRFALQRQRLQQSANGSES